MQAKAAEKARQDAAELQRQKVERERTRIRAMHQAHSKSKVACDPVENLYPNNEHGAILTSLETGCVPTLTPKSQLFVAGLGEQLIKQCELPVKMKDRITVANFVAASVPVGVGGRNYGNSDVGVMMQDQVSSQMAYTAGSLAFKNFDGCSDRRAIAISNSLVRYLSTTSNQSIWVQGCEIQYATLYSKNQCQCMVDAIRGFDPGIHSREFSRSSIKSMIGGNPMAALQMAVKCGVGDY